MVNVIVGRKRTVQVSTNATAGIIDTAAAVNLKGNPSIGNGISRLDRLNDVDATSEVDKATLVYDAATDKYVVKLLEYNDIVGELDIDGGTF